jgi:hypothetical protein
MGMTQDGVNPASVCGELLIVQMLISRPFFTDAKTVVVKLSITATAMIHQQV